eukprot:2464337-Amphidinium_carterae.1
MAVKLIHYMFEHAHPINNFKIIEAFGPMEPLRMEIYSYRSRYRNLTKSLLITLATIAFDLTCRDLPLRVARA